LKYRTIDEAEAAIPLCEEIFSHAVRLRDEAEQKAIRLREVEMGESPDAGESALLRSQLQFLVNGVNEWMRKIVEFGAMPKGLEPGLVDFPYRHEGREVYLCWARGEKAMRLVRAVNAFGAGGLGYTEDDYLSGDFLQFGVAPVRIEVTTLFEGVAQDKLWGESVEGRLGGVSVKFPSLECLLANKRATGRPKDLRDAESLDPGE